MSQARTIAGTKTILACLLFSLIGCAGEHPTASSFVSKTYDSSKSPIVIDGEIADKLIAGRTAEKRSSLASINGIANRKIIYNTSIGLVVDDYDSFETDLPNVVAQHGGFVASSNTDRRYNDNQSGTWVVRLPVDEYSAFMNGVGSLGFAESRNENAQDVTEEYVDTTARIKNKKQLEVRVLEMLEQRNGPLKDVLEIERELSRIREAIERMEGRLRFLKDRTSLATITIQCREDNSYQPVAAPTLAARIKQSWLNSIGSLQQCVENLLVGLIGATPWLILSGLFLGMLFILTRKFWSSAARFFGYQQTGTQAH